MPVQCHIAGRSSNRMRKEIRSNVTLRGTMPFVYRPINIYIFRPKRTMCTSKSLRLVAWVGDVWHLAKDKSQAWDLCTAYETYQHCASYCVCQYTVLSGYIIPHLISTKPSYTGDRRNNNCQTSRQLAMSNLICSCARTLPLLLSSAQRLIRRAQGVGVQLMQALCDEQFVIKLWLNANSAAAAAAADDDDDDCSRRNPRARRTKVNSLHNEGWPSDDHDIRNLGFTDGDYFNRGRYVRVESLQNGGQSSFVKKSSRLFGCG